MLFHYFRRLQKNLKEESFQWLLKVSLWCIVLFLVFTVLFKFAEGVDWMESIWQAWQTFTTVGYGNAPAVTVAGRVVTMLLSTLGIAFVGALFSAAFDYKAALIEKRRKGLMDNPFNNGYVVFNFPGTTTLQQLIQEWRIVEPDVPVCVVDSRLDELPSSVVDLPKIHFVKGETLSRETYLRANLTNNKAVIIFPLTYGVSESDGATKTIVDNVSHFVGENTRIMHLLVDSNNAWMFAKSKSKSINANLEVLAVVQESQDEFSSCIVEQLLLNTEGANPQTVRPSKVIGWTWEKLQIKLLEVSRQQKVNCNLFALIKNGKPDSCPSPDTLIEEGDCISVIAYKGFNWKDFESKL